jgi:hypothetical protein
MATVGVCSGRTVGLRLPDETKNAFAVRLKGDNREDEKIDLARRADRRAGTALWISIASLIAAFSALVQRACDGS